MANEEVLKKLGEEVPSRLRRAEQRCMGVVERLKKLPALSAADLAAFTPLAKRVGAALVEIETEWLGWAMMLNGRVLGEPGDMLTYLGSEVPAAMDIYAVRYEDTAEECLATGSAGEADPELTRKLDAILAQDEGHLTEIEQALDAVELFAFNLGV